MSDFIIIAVLVIVLLAVMEGSHRRRYRSGYYGPSYVYRPFFIFGPRPPRPRPPRPPRGPGVAGPSTPARCGTRATGGCSGA